MAFSPLLVACALSSAFACLPHPGLTAEVDPVNPPKTVRITGKNGAAKSASTNASNGRLSAGLDDIVKLAKAGVDESVILAFIESSSIAYRPNAQEVLKLRELGISSPIVTAVLRRGEEVRRRAAEARREEAARNAAQKPPAPAAANPAPAPQPANPAPSVQYVVPATYPTVVYASYPTYSYYPAVSYRYRNCYYPRPYYYSSYSYYPRGGYYGGYYSRASLSVGYRGGYYRGYGGYRYCR